MKNILQLLLSVLSGFLIAVFTKIRTTYECFQGTQNEILYALCESLSLPDMPQNLSSDIKRLDFNNCKIKTLTPQSFSKYPALLYMTFYQTAIEKITDKAFLMPLKQLQRIKVEGHPDTPLLSQWKLPKTIEYLHYIKTNIKTISLANQNLPNLGYLSLANNSMTSFPILRPMFPLQKILLDGNPDVVITVEDLFPFCQLKWLFFKELKKTGTQFTKSWTICHCLRLKELIKIQEIQTDFEDDLCGKETNENCSLNLDKRYVKVGKECLPPYEPGHYKLLIKAFIFFLLLSTLGYICYLCLCRKKRSPKEEPQPAEDEEE